MSRDYTSIRIMAEYGTDREVADRARTTIGLDPGDKEIKPEYMRKLYLCEHSPIRIKSYIIRVEGIPSWIATHFARHHVGVTPFIETMRDDRKEYEGVPDRETPVIMELHLNSQAIISISRKRLCNCAHYRTKKVWKDILDELEKFNPSLVKCCVPDCYYRGWCYEHKTCGLHLTDTFKKGLNAYRQGINSYQEE